MAKRYSPSEKQVILGGVPEASISRWHMENVVAPRIAKQLNRGVGAICKQLEILMGKHWTDQWNNNGGNASPQQATPTPSGNLGTS